MRQTHTLGLALISAVALSLAPPRLAADTTITYTFNTADQLTQVSSSQSGVLASFTYDGDGQRISKTSAVGQTIYVRGALGEIIAEYTGTGQLIAEYVYLDGQRLCKITHDAQGIERRVYYHADIVGTPVALTDEAGNAIVRAEYYPFGEEVVPGAAPDPHKFTGKELDDESGLYYFGARYYDANLGRFISVDPLPGMATLPESWNRYIYVRNNPLRLIDPDGRRDVVTEMMSQQDRWARQNLTPEEYARFARSRNAGFLAAAGIGVAALAALELAPPILAYLSTPQGQQLGADLVEALNPNPGGFGLSAKIAATFEGGEYTARVLSEDMVVYRAEGTAFGKYYGTAKPTSAGDAERLYNVADYGNDLLEVATYRIPRGATVYEGTVAGGKGTQVFVADPQRAGVQLLEREPLAQYGH